ncbi:hypothetical protein QO021_30300 (plasmid) [Pseudomonas amygdali pv. lachrymans]|uniref:hypothetical protein n=1 Tax=Pseudomonas amygdali TaxID=47877 RepID=UPI0006B9BF73|nr:hypothetical protein [Pseudomonas amygdali]RMM39118.1 hypothetical protein ALQ79_200632 [Pseudomonas amygdali pv. lachrymans]WIO61380.1 hypothetical protein QO021_30300 [Pseudomonas amygdali pv. lachrymans]
MSNLATNDRQPALKLLAIETKPHSFAFHYSRDGREWTVQLGAVASEKLQGLINDPTNGASQLDQASLNELRKFGLIVLNPDGGIKYPVSVTEIGIKTAKGLAEIRTAPAVPGRLLITDPE